MRLGIIGDSNVGLLYEPPIDEERPCPVPICFAVNCNLFLVMAAHKENH